MEFDSSPPANEAGTTQEGTALEHDVVETLTDYDHVARCPGCGRETLWCDREFLTHTDDCEVAR
jgi:hypothetical protein